MTTFAVLLGLCAAAAAGSAAAAPVPVKTIKIFNNTEKPLFPVLETNLTPADEWLQGVFRATDTKRDTYAHTQLYRVYILPETGIAPKESAVVKVPFYSDLVANPKATIPDQYIDWWNGTRVYLYDDKAAIAKEFDPKKQQPVEPLTKSITCEASSKCGPLTVYSPVGNQVALPGNDPSQLMEYTFADVVTANGAPFHYDPTHVDYDISYVDQIYLPEAVEPLNNTGVGYVGSVQEVPDFRVVLDKFLTAAPGWPTYIGTPPYPHTRIPAAYNAILGGDHLTKPGLTIDLMRDTWRICTNGGGGARCDPYKKINTFFRKNYAKYRTLDCNPHLQLTEKLLIEHVYGWVPFNENCKNAASANALAKTPGYEKTQATYIALQLESPYKFNPYVALIHDETYLKMNAYAFSIDDAVGNMNEVGDGLIIAVGGKEGLANGKPFRKDKVIHVNLQPGLPTWTAYGICSNKPGQNLNGQLSFNIYTVDYPCRIVVVDSKQREYTFWIKNEPPDPKIDCRGSSQPDWCRGIIVSTDVNKAWFINLPGRK